MSGRSWIAVCVSKRSFQPTPVWEGARSVGCWCALWTRGGNVSLADRLYLHGQRCRHPQQDRKHSSQRLFIPLRFFFISATGLNQYRKLSMDAALLGGRNPTCFLVLGFVVFCSVVWSTVCTPAGSDSPALSERVSCRELGETWVFPYFLFSSCTGGRPGICGRFFPCSHIKTAISYWAGAGTHLPVPGKAAVHTKAELEQLMSHSCSAFLKVLVISPVTKIFWSTLNFWCW